MLLGELIQGLGIQLASPKDASVRICDITEDSRTAMPGSLFIARAGLKSDGRAYIGQAIAADAAAILTDPGAPRPPEAAGVAWLTSDNLARSEAMLGERWFGEPSKRLNLVGVTGTNGKTTVTHLVYQLMNASRRRCGLIGTVTVDDGRVSKAAMTTPPALEISFSLSRMVESGYRACAMEVSSHALAQDRVAALEFDVAVFTNLSGDHLDYHRTMEEYSSAKAHLFSMLAPAAVAIVNGDDPAHQRMVRDCRARVLICGIGHGAAECWATSGPMTLSGTAVTLGGPWGVIEGSIRLIGTYNLMNVLQSVASAHVCGVSRDAIALALHTMNAPPGRLEMVSSEAGGDDIGVFVDYAHSDDSLAKVLGAVAPLTAHTGGRLRLVFGCGGDRDRTKRPRMAKAAYQGAGEIYITSDNPRTESPSAIIREIMAGLPDPGDARVHVDADRRTAIFKAIEGAAPGDVVVIAGKGHEDYQLISDGAGGILRLEFDDRVVARAALEQRASRVEPATGPGAPLNPEAIARRQGVSP